MRPETTITVGYATGYDFHRKYDIALFHGLSVHSYMVNMFSMDHSFWTNQERLGNFNYSDNVEVFKYGVASGLTRGKFVRSSVSPPLFWVRSTEVGDFAMRGDSGSLIICSRTKMAVGVISQLENVSNRVVCIMLQYLYEVPTLEWEVNGIVEEK